MEKIGFIGTFDKTDFLIYVSRILVEMGKKVLIIDSTVNQKAKYVVPVISPTMSYVTEYEGIDVAVGFSDYNGIKKIFRDARNGSPNIWLYNDRHG